MSPAVVHLGQSATRAQLVAAVDGLAFTWLDRTDTIAAYPTEPRQPQPFDAWPSWARTEPVGWATGPVAVTWDVLVVLPQEYPAPPQLEDGLAEALIRALAPLGAVERAEPTLLVLAGEGTPRIPGIRVAITV